MERSLKILKSDAWVRVGIERDSGHRQRHRVLLESAAAGEVFFSTGSGTARSGRPSSRGSFCSGQMFQTQPRFAAARFATPRQGHVSPLPTPSREKCYVGHQCHN